MLTLLEMMPDVVMKKILEECGIVGIQRLRKTCHTLRNTIDDFKPDPLIFEVTILVQTNQITFRLASSKSRNVNLIYEKTPKGTLLRNCDQGWRYQKMLKNMDILDVFCQDFELILRNQKSKIDNFKLDFRYYEGDRCDQYLSVFGGELLEKMRTVLPKRMALKVKNLELMVTNQESILAILPYLDAKSIESLKFSDAYGTVGRELDIEKIIELPHWKSARKISISQFSVSAPIQKFLHFENGSIYLKTIATDDIILMKNNSLNSPNFVRFCVNLSVKNTENQEFFIEKYGLPYRDTRYREKTAVWVFEKDEKTVVRMVVNSYLVAFERHRKKSVPSRIRILE
ncbi:unnamed protein product [Caenorhabditis brenneri]